MNKRLTKLWTEFDNIWSKIEIGQRITLVLITGGVLAGLLGLVIWSSRPSFSTLYTNLGPAETSKVIEELDAEEVDYRLGFGGRSIKVPREHVARLRVSLAAKGVTQPGDGYEIIDQSRITTSRFMELKNYKRALEGELQRTIAQFDGVQAAHVKIVTPEHVLLETRSAKPTASVFLVLNGRLTLDASTVSSIQSYVAGSVEGLETKDVLVADNTGRTLSTDADSESIAGLSNQQLRIRREWEEQLSNRAQRMLETVLGAGKAVVKVAVEINTDTVTASRTYYEPEGTLISETTTDESTISNRQAIGGVVGVAANVGNTNYVANPTGNSNNVTRTQTQRNYELTQSVTNVVHSAGSINRITAAIMVAARFEENDGVRTLVPRTPEQLKVLEDLVRDAIGIQSGAGMRQDEITISEQEFNDNTLREIAINIKDQGNRRFWLELGEKAFFATLALVVLFAFWRTLKHTKKTEVPFGGIPIGDFEQYLNENADVPSADGTPMRRSASDPKKAEGEPITVDSLSRLIQEHPTNMTQAVRSWLTTNDSSSS